MDRFVRLTSLTASQTAPRSLKKLLICLISSKIAFHSAFLRASRFLTRFTCKKLVSNYYGIPAWWLVSTSLKDDDVYSLVYILYTYGSSSYIGTFTKRIHVFSFATTNLRQHSESLITILLHRLSCTLAQKQVNRVVHIPGTYLMRNGESSLPSFRLRASGYRHPQRL